MFTNSQVLFILLRKINKFIALQPKSKTVNLLLIPAFIFAPINLSASPGCVAASDVLLALNEEEAAFTFIIGMILRARRADLGISDTAALLGFSVQKPSHRGQTQKEIKYQGDF